MTKDQQIIALNKKIADLEARLQANVHALLEIKRLLTICVNNMKGGPVEPPSRARANPVTSA